MRPALSLFTSSLRQALPRRRTIIFTIIELTAVGIYLLATKDRTELYALEGAMTVGGNILFSLVFPVITMVVASGVLGSERRDQTLSFIALRPIPRVTIATVKILAATSGAFALNLIGALALASAHMIRFDDTQLFLGLIAGTGIATIAYAAILVPLGFLTDRAVIIGVAYLLVFEDGIAAALPALSSMSPWRVGVAMFGSLMPEGTVVEILKEVTGTLELNTFQPAVTASVFLLVGIAVTTLLLRTKDLA